MQAPLDGLASTFGNPSYATIFQAFSPVRLFSAVKSNQTDSRFFIPGGGELPAATHGFGAVFTDVDIQEKSVAIIDGKKRKVNPTILSFFDAAGTVLYTAVAPASAGNGSLSFLGVVFSDARIARVRILAGSVAPGPDDSTKREIVMMDDFIYGEPQALTGPAALQLLDEADAARD